jgi:hypothetical protein
VERIGIDDPTGLAGGAERRESAREVEGDAMTADTGFRARFATSFDRVRGGQRRELDAPRDAGAVVPAPRQGEGVPVAALADAKVWLAESGT